MKNLKLLVVITMMMGYLLSFTDPPASGKPKGSTPAASTTQPKPKPKPKPKAKPVSDYHNLLPNGVRITYNKYPDVPLPRSAKHPGEEYKTLYYTFTLKNTSTASNLKVYAAFNGETNPVRLRTDGTDILHCVHFYDNVNYAGIDFIPPADHFRVEITIVVAVGTETIFSETYQDILISDMSPYVYEYKDGQLCNIVLRHINTIAVTVKDAAAGCPVVDVEWPPVF